MVLLWHGPRPQLVGEQTDPVALDLLSSWTTELLPLRILTLYGRDRRLGATRQGAINDLMDSWSASQWLSSWFRMVDGWWCWGLMNSGWRQLLAGFADNHQNPMKSMKWECKECKPFYEIIKNVFKHISAAIWVKRCGMSSAPKQHRTSPLQLHGAVGGKTPWPRNKRDVIPRKGVPWEDMNDVSAPFCEHICINE